MSREMGDEPADSVRPPRTLERSTALPVSVLAIVMIGIVALVVWTLAVRQPARSSHSTGGALGASMPTDPLNRSPEATDYKNPLVAYNLPDPTIIAADNKFYAYTTQTVFGHLIHIPVLASRDLIDWRFVGDALDELPPWANGAHSDTWAPDIVKVDGHYNMYFAERLKGGGRMGIALATSTRPTGPFQVQGDPLMQHRGYIDIDPFVFRDSRDRLLMYWGSDGAPIRVRELSSDGTTFVGKARAVLAPSSASGYEALVEGPSLIEHSGFYYLFYSGNRCCGKEAHYAVLVARSRSPLGPFLRASRNPIIAANGYFNAPGHGTVFHDESGADFILYHAMERSDRNFNRYLMLDRIHWRRGWPVVNAGKGPTRAPQLRPDVGTE
jgi:arabinan endo-1,5-alpha-L-arabinosidase